jgi:methionine sulfoxide reductase catalytic subunit
MILKRKRFPFSLPDVSITPQKYFLDRRGFMKAAALGAGSVITGQYGCGNSGGSTSGGSGFYPAFVNPDIGDRILTDEGVAGRFSLTTEFTLDMGETLELAESLVTSPWEIEVTGLVNNPLTISMTDILNTFDLEERVYRLRCIGPPDYDNDDSLPWAMVVPWTGFELGKLLDLAGPLPNANFVNFYGMWDPENFPIQEVLPAWAWPYLECLRIDEAYNELTILATGVYGHKMPKYHGAPIRLVVPWKYGNKSIKSIVKIELVENQAHTTWERRMPGQFGFWRNIGPDDTRNNWSQKFEQMIGTRDVLPTQFYNGYGDYVAHLYEGMTDHFY